MKIHLISRRANVHIHKRIYGHENVLRTLNYIMLQICDGFQLVFRWNMALPYFVSSSILQIYNVLLNMAVTVEQDVNLASCLPCYCDLLRPAYRCQASIVRSLMKYLSTFPLPQLRVVALIVTTPNLLFELISLRYS